LIEKLKTIVEELSYADPRDKAHIRIENLDININFSEFLSFYVDWLLDSQNQEKIKEMIYAEIADKIPFFLDMTKEEIEASKHSLGYDDKKFTRTFFPLLNIEAVADNIEKQINIICLDEMLGKIAEEKEEWKREVYSLYQNNN